MTCKQINRFLIARQCLWVQKVGTLSIDKVNPPRFSTCRKSNCASHNDVAMHNVRCYIGFMNETKGVAQIPPQEEMHHEHQGYLLVLLLRPFEDAGKLP
jgi:hypothetical protein